MSSLAERARRGAIRSYRRSRGWAIDRRHRIPVPVRRAVRNAERAVDPVLVWAYRRRAGESRPIPPRGIRERNAVETVDYWFEAADQAEAPLHGLLSKLDRRVEDFDRVLDDPPLTYPDDHFDLLWAWSVLTHLDADRQKAWVTEWSRVVRPDGIVLATFNGPERAQIFLPEEQRGSVASTGVAYAEADTSGAFGTDFTGTTESYGDTVNTPEYMKELFTAARFEVLGIEPNAVWGNQDCLMARLNGA